MPPRARAETLGAEVRFLLRCWASVSRDDAPPPSDVGLAKQAMMRCSRQLRQLQVYLDGAQEESLPAVLKDGYRDLVEMQEHKLHFMKNHFRCLQLEANTA